jgi:hypothetical protein
MAKKLGESFPSPNHQTFRQNLRLGLFACGVFVALRFQRRILILGKNAFGFLQEGGPAFLCAAGLHAVRLPRFELRLLIRRQAHTREVGASCLVRRGLGATRIVSLFPGESGTRAKQCHRY